MRASMANLVAMTLMGGALLAGCKGGEASPTAQATEFANAAACDGDKSETACVAAIEAARTAQDDGLTYKLADAGCNRPSGAGCWHLALLQENGRGTPKDLAMSHTTYQKSCDLDYLDACVSLALLKDGETYLLEFGQRADLLLKACKGRNADGCAFLGHALLESDDRRSQADGVRALGMACELGDKSACEAVAQEKEWAAVDAELAGARQAAQVERGPNVEWTVAPAISHLLEFGEMKGCRGNSRLQQCSVVLMVKGKLAHNVRSSVLDADGVRLDYGIALSPRYTTPGVAEAIDINLPTGAAKVVFDY